MTTIWKILISTSSGRLWPHLWSVAFSGTNKDVCSVSLTTGMFTSFVLARTVFFFLIWTSLPFPLVSFFLFTPFFLGVQAEPPYWEVLLDMTRSISSPSWTVYPGWTDLFTLAFFRFFALWFLGSPDVLFNKAFLDFWLSFPWLDAFDVLGAESLLPSLWGEAAASVESIICCSSHKLDPKKTRHQQSSDIPASEVRIRIGLVCICETHFMSQVKRRTWIRNVTID